MPVKFDRDNETEPQGKVGVSQEVLDAEKARQIAEAKAKEARAKKEAIAYAAGCQSLEELLQREKKLLESEATIEQLVNERVKEITEKAERAIEQAEAEQAELKEARAKYVPALKECIADRDKYRDRMRELEKKLGIKEGEEVRARTVADNYNEHLADGVNILRRIASGVKAEHPTLAKYLNAQAAGLEHEEDVEYGMAAFKACSKSIIRVAEMFQDAKDKTGEYSDWADWLCKLDGKLCKVMVISDDRDTRVDGHYPEEEMLPEHQDMLGKITERIGRRIVKGE